MRPILLCPPPLRPRFALATTLRQRRAGPELKVCSSTRISFAYSRGVGSTDWLPSKVTYSVRSIANDGREESQTNVKTKASTGQKSERRLAVGAKGSNASSHGVVQFMDSTLRGMGQVVFANSPLSGLSIIGGLAIADPFLSAFSLLGCTAATATGRALSPTLGLSDQSVKDGLCGYNGALVGCAFWVFLDLGLPSLTLATVLGGAASTLVSAGLGNVITSVPQFTLAFNAVALGTFSFTRPFSAAENVESNATDGFTTVADLSSAPLTGISQIFVAENALCGAAILTALYVQKFDGQGDKNAAAAVAHTVFGSCLGMGTALTLGLPAGDISAGLSGFNPALTALAVHTFLQPSAYAYGIAGGGAIATTFLTGAVAPIAATSLQIPVCTVPFCIAASGCLVAADHLGVKRRI